MTNVSQLPIKDQGESTVYTWNSDTLVKVTEFGVLTTDVKAQRKALNDSLAAGKSELVALGMDQDALAAAISYSKTPPEDQDKWDQTYIFARRALGVPIQEDLFVASMLDTVQVSAKDESKESE